MLVGAVPHVLGNLAAGVQVHAHALLLRALAGEHVRRARLLDLGLADEYFLFGLLVAGLDLDDLASRHHPDVGQLDVDRVVGEDHAHQRRVEAADAANVVLRSPRLDEASDGRARVHAMRDGAGQTGVLGKHPRYVDGVVVPRHARVRLVGRRRLEHERPLAMQRDRVLKVHGLVDGHAVAREVVEHGVAVRRAGFVVHGRNLDDLLGGQLQEDLADGLHRAVHGLVLVLDQALESEGQRLVQELNLRLGHAEPLLGPQNRHVFCRRQI